jgi:hypothetical protein
MPFVGYPGDFDSCDVRLCSQVLMYLTQSRYRLDSNCLLHPPRSQSWQREEREYGGKCHDEHDIATVQCTEVRCQINLD